MSKKFFKSCCREKSKIKKSKRSRGRSAVLNLFIIVIAGLVGVFYLVQTNFIATEGYKIDNLQEQITELEDQNRRLEMRTIEMRSIVNLDGRVAQLDMIEVEKVVHLDKVSTAVAVR